MNHSRIDLGRYVVTSIWFGCNNDCEICMLSGMKRDLPPIGFENFQRLLREIAAEGKFENLILSGAEVTTFDELERYVRFAASLGWFRTIQLQTNGRRLQEEDYLRRLVDCGVNEFFVSIHGLEAVHDAVTRRQGAFAETQRALDLLENLDVSVLTNTVLTRRNVEDVPRLFPSLFRRRIREVHLWNYYPMEETDSKDLVVGLEAFEDLLPGLLETAGKAGKPLVLKSFPECLSRGFPGYFDSRFPVTILPERFWEKFAVCGFGACVHRGPCEKRECWGLSSAYRRKYGDERDRLRPMIGGNP